MDAMEGRFDRRIAGVPAYDDIVERNAIRVLEEPGDLAFENGDLAVTRWGDLKLKNEDYSAYVGFVQRWRYNYPTQRFLFETVFDGERKRLLEGAQESLPRVGLEEALQTGVVAFTLKDPDVWHRLNEEIGAEEVAKGLYAGAIAVFLGRSLMTFQTDIGADHSEWSKSGPRFGGRSVGEVVAATANNVRHNDEWHISRPPSPMQLKSMRVLADVLREPLVDDGRAHRFGREVAPDTLKVLSEGDFDRLEANVFAFTNDLIGRRQRRRPSC